MTPTWLLEYQSRVEKNISDFFRNRYPESVDEVERKFFEGMQYAVLGSGKRIRAILALLAYEYVCSKPYDEAIFCAVRGIEFLHAYTLVHDDLPVMDNDVMRRGKPTAWKVYGETLATLIGDGLQTLAFEEIANTTHIEVVKEIAQALGDKGVVLGQVRDTMLVQNTLSIDELMRIHDEKTGGFIASSLVVGGIIGGASDSVLGELRQLGILLGRGFQIQDDILDYEGDSVTLGKTAGKDAETGKGIVALIGINAAKHMLIDISERIASSPITSKNQKIQEICEYILNRKK